MGSIKQLLLTIIFLCWAVPAHATISYWFNSYGTQSSAAAVRYFPCMGNGTIMTSTEGQSYVVVPATGNITKIWVKIDTDPTNTNARQDIALRQGVNGAARSATSTVCSVNVGSTTCSDTSHTQTYTAGDSCNISITPANTPSVTRISTMIEFSSTTAGETVLMASDPNVTYTTAQYTTVFGPAVSSSATESGHQIILPASGTVKAMFWQLDTVPGVGTDRKFEARLDSVTQSMTITFGAAENQVKSDTAHPFTNTAGQRLNLLITLTGAPAASNQAVSVVWVPDDGVSFIIPATTRTTSLSNSVDNFVNFGGAAGNATETVVQTIWRSNFTVTAAYYRISGQPDPGKQYTFSLQDNTAPASTTFSKTISGTNTNDSSTGSFVPTDGNLYDVLSHPATTPVARTFTSSFLANANTGTCRGAMMMMGAGGC